ncbi:uncharacterized protein [Erythrolamprus reginae]|uniref:uncharacterized protein n=1 Tax=Erythrolamprus reginae TaxID=121349 RepID=UPI00396CE2CA
MILWLHLTCLIAVLKGAQSQPRLVESGGDVKRPGESLRITCRASGFNISDHDMGWLRQPSGKGLEWISHINPSSSKIVYADKVKGRFTTSRNNVDHQLYLQMNHFRPEDTADYYCASYTARGMAFSEVHLVSTGPGVISPRDNLQLVCKVTGFSIRTQNYVWHWSRQPFGKALEWISGTHPYSGNKWYSPSVKNRATISSDGSKNEFYFQLNSVSVADSAVYFCSRERGEHNERS